MGNERVKARPLRTKGQSSTTTLIQAALVALLLVPGGTVAVEADLVTCSFGTYYGGIDLLSTGSCSGTSPSSSTFSWFDDVTGDFLYSFSLSFVGLDPETGFNITIDDQALDQTTFDLLASDVAALYGTSYDCIPLVDDPAPCRNFFMTDYPSGPDEPWDSYLFSIFWVFKAGATTATVLHDIGESDNPNYLDNGLLFDEDMCIEYMNCTFDPDPEISSGDTDFQGFTPAQVVPEPSSVLLLATSLGALAYRRRRGRRRPDHRPMA